MGRLPERNAARRAIERGASGVVFAGEPGVGKTSLARALVEEMEATGRYEVLWLFGTATEPEIPFCAFAPYVPDVTGVTDGELASLTLLQSFRAAVLRRAAGRRLLLVVDDAHLLDGHTATLVLQLVTAGEASVVVAVQSGMPIESALRSLWKEELAERIDVHPLGHDDTAELVGGLLVQEGPLAATPLTGTGRRAPSPVGGELTESVWRMSNGNPLYARELVLCGLRQGRIALRDGAWRLEGDLEVGPRLAELLTERLAVLSPGEREALELVAHGAPLPLALRVLIGLAGSEPVETLHHRGLIDLYLNRGEQMARVAHPVTAETVRQSLPVHRAVELGRRLADALEADGRGDSELVRIVTWRLHAGVHCDPDALVRASRRSAEHDQWRHAEWLARQARRAGAGAEGVLALADAQRAMGRFEGALSTLGEEPGQGDDQIARMAILRASILALGLGRLDDALAALDDAQGQLGDRPEWAWLEGVRAGLLGFASRPEEAVSIATGLLGDDRLSAQAEVTARSALAMGLAWTGRTERALGVLDLMTGDTDQMAVLSSWAITARVLTLQLAGRMDLVERLSRRRYDVAVRTRDRFSQGAAAVSLGVVAMSRGRLQQAINWLGEGTGALRAVNSPSIGVPAQLTLAEALALAGDTDGARDALDLARPISDGPTRTAAGWSVASGWLAAAQGYLSEAVQLMHEGASTARARGIVAAEIRALHAAVRLGSARPAPRLAELASWVEGPLVAVISDHATALGLAEGSGEALDAVTERYGEMGLALYAAEAAAQAGQAHTSAGQPRRAAASTSRGHFLLGSEADSTPPLGLALALAPPTLTRREREVARLAAGGLPSPAIATRLCLSVRTVETHLARAYLKLGISSRSELAQALLRGGGTPDRIEAG